MRVHPCLTLGTTKLVRRSPRPHALKEATFDLHADRRLVEVTAAPLRTALEVPGLGVFGWASTDNPGHDGSRFGECFLSSLDTELIQVRASRCEMS